MILDDSFDLLLTPNPKLNEVETIKLPTLPCKLLYLLKSNFLSEFFTKSEKLKVLLNLGITELAGGGNWGNIQGNIKELLDLIDYVSNPLNIKYVSTDNPDITNLKEALDKVLYTPLTIRMTITPNIAELGTTVNEVNVLWQFNKLSIVSQTLNNILIPTSKRNYIMINKYTANLLFTLKVIDSTKSYEISTLLEFVPAIYYANAVNTPTLPTANKLLTKNRLCTININAADYIYIFMPTKYGVPSFYVGGFEGGFLKVGNTVYNTTTYDIWRSDNANLGQTTINIK